MEGLQFVLDISMGGWYNKRCGGSYPLAAPR